MASTTYTFNDITVNNILTHKMPFSEGDLTLIQQEPNLLAALAMGEATPISSVTVDGDDVYMPCSEVSGAYVVDQRAGYGIIDDKITSYNGYQEGCSFSVGGTTSKTSSFTASGDSIFFIKPIVSATSIYKVDAYFEILSGELSAKDASGMGYETLGVGAHSYSFIVSITQDIATTLLYMVDTSLGSYEAQNVCVDVREATASEIANYTETIRTNANQLPNGLQTTALVLDGAGVPTSVDNTKLNWYGDGMADVQFNPSEYSEFIIEESVGAIFYSHIYDGTNLTTWTDGVEGTATAHTPEDANYLLGKGAYPKVDADGFDTYTLDYFKAILDTDKIANYNATDAYNDYTGV